jgi:hypothetical protein
VSDTDGKSDECPHQALNDGCQPARSARDPDDASAQIDLIACALADDRRGVASLAERWIILRVEPEAFASPVVVAHAAIAQDHQLPACNLYIVAARGSTRSCRCWRLGCPGEPGQECLASRRFSRSWAASSTSLCRRRLERRASGAGRSWSGGPPRHVPGQPGQRQRGRPVSRVTRSQAAASPHRCSGHCRQGPPEGRVNPGCDRVFAGGLSAASFAAPDRNLERPELLHDHQRGTRPVS